MRKNVVLPLILGSFLLTTTVYPQDSKQEEEQVYIIVEKMPSFPGGTSPMMAYILKNLKYPKKAKEEGISGVVMVQFVVSKKGLVYKAKVMRGIGGGCDEEALRLVNAMPTWNPGTQRGKPVNVQYTLLIKFRL